MYGHAGAGIVERVGNAVTTLKPVTMSSWRTRRREQGLDVGIADPGSGKGRGHGLYFPMPYRMMLSRLP